MLHPIVDELLQLVEEHGWQRAFRSALADVAAHRIAALAGIESLDDYAKYLDDMVRWAPREQGDSRLVHDKLVQFQLLDSWVEYKVEADSSTLSLEPVPQPPATETLCSSEYPGWPAAR